MKSNTEMLQEILSLVKEELIPSGEMGYTAPDEKYHIYIYKDHEDNWDGQIEEEFYVIEPNKVKNGAHEPLGGTNYLTSSTDISEVLIGCQWCLDIFEEDRQKEATISQMETVHDDVLPDEVIVRMAHEAGWMEAEGKIEIHEWDDLRTAIRDSIQSYYENPSEKNPFEIEDVIKNTLLERFAAEHTPALENLDQLDALPKDTLIDLLKAFDSYISASSAEPGYLNKITGWHPNPLYKFFNEEFQTKRDPEKGRNSFDYMYKEDDLPAYYVDFNTGGKPKMGELTLIEFFKLAEPGHILRKDDGGLVYNKEGDDGLLHLRSCIQDIHEGDAFMVQGPDHQHSNIFIAGEDAHQNHDEPDEPWIVYGKDGASFFEEDVVNVERLIAALEHGKAYQQVSNGIPVRHVTLVMDLFSEEQTFSQPFWVDAKTVATADLFRAAVHDYLSTPAGTAIMKNFGGDFNWGDAMIHVPEGTRNKYGLYTAYPALPPQARGLSPVSNFSDITLKVDHDENLVPDSYYEKQAEKPSLTDQIQTAGAKVNNPSEKETHRNIEPLEK